jgi:hypothetical protein
MAAIAGVAVGAVMGLGIGLWYSGLTAMFAPAVSGQRFNADLVPLVLDSTRAQLAEYQHEPDAKAIAISREGWGMSFGAANIEAAKNEAIERCWDRDKGGFCRIYATGGTVVWSQSAYLCRFQSTSAKTSTTHR